VTDRPFHSRRLVRIAVQLIGFAIGAALLVWAVRLALNEENSDQLKHLADAPLLHVVGLFALSVVTIILNGLIFHQTLVPVRRLRRLDVVAVNALATLLNYLPFKLSIISRVLIHNRRDGVPLGEIAGWLAAVGVSGVIGFGPVALVSIWHPTIDALWIGLSGAGVVLLAAVTIALSRYFGGASGHARLERIGRSLRIPYASALLNARLVTEAHQGLDMLGHVRTVALVVALRLVDLAVQAGRFLVAAALLGVGFSPGQAMVFAVVYFFIGVVSPAGMLGLREGGTIAFAALLGMTESQYTAFAPVPLLVTATEAVVAFAMAGVSIAWLRPDRLLRGQRETASV
jgi:Lysylphosphatidylglycerol synthase TM region